MADFQVELQDAELLRGINSLVALMEEPRELLQDIGDKLETNAQVRWDTKVDPLGQAWAPISEATKEIYQSEWFIARNPAFAGGIPGSLMERTRQLRDSLAFNVGDQWVDIGTTRTVPGRSRPTWQVGWLHELGTSKMPRRGILMADPKRGTLGPQDQADLLAIISGFIDRSIG